MLNNRLLTVARHVPARAKVLDVGCDHAHLAIYLLKNHLADSVIASDIVNGPVEAARKNIKMAGLQEKLKLIQADGVLGIKPGEADCVIIAGMGAATIIEILTAGKEIIQTCQTLILQPMIAADKLRLWLADNAWVRIADDLCLDNSRLYEIIVAQPAQKSYTISKLQALIGDTQAHELFPQHLQAIADKQQLLLNSLQLATNKQEVQNKIQACQTLLQEVNSYESMGNK